MGRIVLIAILVTFAATLGAEQASAETKGLGNCFNWFRDDDGDGIPNGLDDDWIRPEDGTGYKMGHSFGPMPSLTLPTSGDQNRHQYRQRKNKPEESGDQLRARLRLGDQTCK